MANELLTISQVAKAWQVSERTVRDLVRGGQLPAVRIGTGRGVIRFRPEDLTAYLAVAGNPCPSSSSARVAKLLGL